MEHFHLYQYFVTYSESQFPRDKFQLTIEYNGSTIEPATDKIQKIKILIIEKHNSLPEYIEKTEGDIDGIIIHSLTRLD